VPDRIVYLFEVQLNSLREIRERLVDRVPLTGHINLQALRDVPVLFPVQGSCQSARNIGHAHRVTAADEEARPDGKSGSAPGTRDIAGNPTCSHTTLGRS
jgi:hypothetical protein